MGRAFFQSSRTMAQVQEWLSQRKDLRGVDVGNDWKLLLTSDEIQQSVTKCAKVIDEKFEGQEIVVVCILKGCVYFFVDFTRALTIPYSTYFIEASSYHNAQTQSETVELLSVLVPEKFEGKKVILLDEMYDNGTTLHEVKQTLLRDLKKSEDEIFTCTLFRKEKETSYPMPDQCGLVLPDVWVVGYGLDDAQEKRGWPHLFACPKVAGVPKTEGDKIFDSDEELDKQRQKLLSQL